MAEKDQIESEIMKESEMGLCWNQGWIDLQGRLQKWVGEELLLEFKKGIVVAVNGGEVKMVFFFH